MAEKTGMVDNLCPIPPTLQFTSHPRRLRTLGGCAYNLLFGGGRLLIFLEEERDDGSNAWQCW